MGTVMTIHSSDWAAIMARIAGITVLLAGVLLAASLCVASTPANHGVPSIFDPRSTPAETIRHLSGALMWTCGTLVYLVPATIISMRLLKPQTPAEHDLTRPQSDGPAPQMNSQSLEVV